LWLHFAKLWICGYILPSCGFVVTFCQAVDLWLHFAKLWLNAQSHFTKCLLNAYENFFYLGTFHHVSPRLSTITEIVG
jgi:hypothetical protein